ncbi:outer membrane protein assembly factor BamD [Pseudomaricurvus alkylphenolicus]|jgi:outer membrane protein assembly factor BamD|uniref:outer membrane protein assembly factor BamD n=1 Tax=Pseudomaricurvus alkylphenolicus TaxID=1306991 RepID=UPI00142286D1|nr:outer membrane protein assembly factor BamD [Pseudomaricurvus alkylphenolicus]NIB40237.1 outer membrane protein assembly factor BamD [Pseudomaricurvus alkylphenolicus]
MYVRLLMIAASLFLLAACSSQEEQGPSYTTEKDFYEAAQRQLKSRQWELAIENLQALEANFPFGTYAEQAQLELIYAYYRNFEHEASSAAADRFIRLHPQHRNVDYAYYMKGLASFTEGSGMFERFLPTDLTQRDPGSARQSFAYFSQLLARYPKSQYAPDARKRMIYLRNLLARYEIHVANYYLKRGAYVAAANRGRYVVENFQQTPAVPDALAVMVQSYDLLEMKELGDNALKTLASNYPNHPALESGEFDYQYRSRLGERSWVSYATFGLFDKKEPPGFDSRELYNPEYLNRDINDPIESDQVADKERSWLNWITFGLVD